MNGLIRKIAQKITADYCNLSIVENLDRFLTQDDVCHLLRQECNLELITGNNLQLRIHYELNYKQNPNQRFVYICNSISTLLADMKKDAAIIDFSISDVFPLFDDKTLLRKQSFETLDELYRQVAIRKVNMHEGRMLISNIAANIEERKRRSSEFFCDQLSELDIDWNKPAETIASVSRVLAKAIKEGVYDGIDDCINDINNDFQNWVDQEYFATLQSNHLLKAKSVNKIFPHISDNHTKEDKVALLVVDGFSYWQYTILKDYLKKAKLTIEDGCTLAWMPSITMLSRQAIFRGATPLQDYKQNPDNEKRLWFDYWKNQGFNMFEIQYLYDTDEFAINEGVKRLAVVTVEMDEKMHSSTDYKDLYSLTENWCPRIMSKIETIVNAGYKLFITTDHGSVLSHGWRALNSYEKAFLYKDGSRGKRHLIYNNKDEQERFFSENTDLPMVKHDNWIAIRDAHCFANNNMNMITHGGSHFLEMVVPLITIKK